MRVSIIHMETRNTVEDAISAAQKNIYKAADKNPNFIVLPEYFSVPGFIEKFSSAEEIFQKTYRPTIEFLRHVSGEILNIYLVGGTLIEKSPKGFFNTCTLWKNGELLGKYEKRNLVNAEIKIGVSEGDKPFVFSTEFCKIGVLICADIFDSNSVEQTISMGAETIFLPVAALHAHPDVKGHPLSEKIASEKGVFIVKAGSVRSGAKGGRSAVIAPWGVIGEAPDVSSDIVLTIDLDLSKLKSYRKTQ
ncbi:MAG: carbon-nitrogen hydrolase family protein [Candidatus Bathyarchaeia archaeon]